MTGTFETIHATTVSIDGRAVLVLGPSGSGKSELAMRLMSLGAGLIADDGTQIRLDGGQVLASCPDTIRGRIEIRGIGILNADPAGPAPVALVVDLGQVETERLPPFRTKVVLGQDLPCLYKIESGHFPAAILQYLRYGRHA